MQDSVTVHMSAPPAKVWDLVSDVTKIGRYSPETFEAEWLEGARARLTAAMAAHDAAAAPADREPGKANGAGNGETPF